MPESKVPWFVMTLMITRLKTQDAIVVANEGILGWDFYCIFFGFIILAGWLLFSRGWQVNPPQITTILINDSRRVWARLLLQSFLLQELVRSFFSECCPECRKQKEFFPLCLFKVFLGVFYHAKSPLNNHLGEYFQFFPTTLSKAKFLVIVEKISVSKGSYNKNSLSIYENRRETSKRGSLTLVWSNYSDLTWPGPPWWWLLVW